jgi:AcrR family transcriptional regulator
MSQLTEGRRTRDSSRTRARLLEAGRAEFAEYGIAGARVDRIAAAAGCNKAMIYAYFENKDGLFDAVFAAHARSFQEKINFDPDDLPAYAGRLIDGFEDDPAVMRLISWYRLERAASAPMPAVVSANERRLERLRVAQREGRLTTRYDPAAILALVHGIAGSWATRNPEFGSLQSDRAARRLAVVDAVARVLAAD